MTIDLNRLQILYPSRYKAQQLVKTLQTNPSFVKPVVTKSDVDRKMITRYFIRGVSDCSEVLEINSIQFDDFKDNTRFVTTKLDWKIVGNPYSSTTSYGAIDLGVEDFNKKQVELVDRKFECLKNYIRDYLELWYSDGNGNRTFTRREGILNPPFPSRVAFVPPRINVFNVPIPTPSVTSSQIPVPSVTPSSTPTPTPTPSITPSITPSPYIGNEGVWSGWAPLYPPIVTAGIAIITE